MMDTKNEFFRDMSRHQTIVFQPSIAGMRLAKIKTLLFVLVFLAPVITATAQTNSAHDSAVRIVEEEISRFEREFADIEFVWLTGKTDSLDALKLMVALGKNHELLDYEHHAHHVEGLNALNLDRIKMMLAYDSPSSSLYRVWKDRINSKPYVVVLTLNPGLLMGERRSSTCYMYDIEIADFSNIAQKSRVDNAAYLRYVVRHEIAHALKAYLFGGHAFTNQPLGGDYNSYLSEIWADMFAIMMERRFGSGDIGFIRTLVDARTVALVTNFDIQHFTSPQVDSALQVELTGVSSLRELANLGQAEYLKVKPSYESYEVLAMTAYHLRYSLDGSPFDALVHDEVVAEYEVAPPQEDLLAQLTEEAEAAMHRVFR